MQADTERIPQRRTRSGQSTVHPRLRVVESPTRRQGQALREPPDGGLVGERDGGLFQSAPAIDPHRVRPGHQHIRDVRIVQQRFEHARTGHLGLQQPQRPQQVRVAEHPACLGSDRSGELRRIRIACLRGQSLTHSIQQLTCEYRTHSGPLTSAALPVH